MRKILALSNLVICCLLFSGSSLAQPTKHIKVCDEQDAITLSIFVSASEILESFGYKRTVASLITALNDECWPVRTSAVARLGSLFGDERAVPPLIKALKDKNRLVRTDAAKALGSHGDKRGIPPLFEALKDEHSHVRKAAAEALGRFDDKRAVLPLIEALKDEAKSVIINAAKALARHGDKRAVLPLINALNDEYSPVRKAAAKALSSLGDRRAVPSFIKALKDEDRHVRRTAAEALGSLGDKRAVPPLIKALKDEDADMRIKAVVALGQLGDTQAISHIRNLLITEPEETIDPEFITKPEIIAYINIALARLGDARAFDYFFTFLNSSYEHTQLKIHTIRELGTMGDKRAFSALISILNNKDAVHGDAIHELEAIQATVYTALAKLGDVRATDYIVVGLKDEWIDLREVAAKALGILGDKRAIKPLVSALDDNDNNEIRATVQESLKQLGY